MLEVRNLTRRYGDNVAAHDISFEVPRGQFPPDEDIRVGMQVQGEGEHGVLSFTVVEVNGQGVVLDANHPMAGKNLNFDVEVLGVREATEQELSHGHVHAHGHDH